MRKKWAKITKLPKLQGVSFFGENESGPYRALSTKMGLKRPFEIRIVTKFSTFYGMYRHYPHKFTHFFVVPDVFALFDIFSEKSATSYS